MPVICARHASIVAPELGAHAIVNAGNPALGMGSGVSGAIRDACGGHPFQESVRERLEEEFDGPLRAEDCLVTDAGTCSAFRWVLHVASVDYRRRDPETGGATGPSRVRSCFLAVLREATELASEENLEGQFVLATPLLGAGHGGLGPVTALEAMIRGLAEHLAEVAPHRREVLRSVVFAVLTAEEARLVPLAAASHRLRTGPPAGTGD
ncbi:MAG TPA: macro domain-containing protein [Myxococcaceae bacterium]|nr:macro domain-containing protein [Myxococcaceae bacterium]